jgi:transposase
VSGVMIGIDPHKGSHTALALDASETKLGQLRVRAAVGQVDGLLDWARRWPDRSWAIEGATGLGHLLAQQLLAAGTRCRCSRLHPFVTDDGADPVPARGRVR